jgi:uncharacterized membrane protein YeaQ/YmgE (transglycosylase-associated protein family)
MGNIMLWVLAGGIAGWIGYAFAKFNKDRGLLISIIIGMLGGYLGGNVLASMFGAGVTVNVGDFNPFRLFIAFASATACLTISNMIYKRFGF